MVSAISRTIMPYTGPSCKAVNEATEMGYLTSVPCLCNRSATLKLACLSWAQVTKCSSFQAIWTLCKVYAISVQTRFSSTRNLIEA